MYYFDQTKPNKRPLLFFPGIIKRLIHSSPAFTKDSNEVYWSTVKHGDKPRTIYYAKYQDGSWSDVQTADFSGDYDDDHPFISHDGKTLFFASNRPSKIDDERKLRMWKVEKTDIGWGEAQEVGKPIGMWTPSLTINNTLYYMDSMKNSSEGDSKNQIGIFRSELVNGEYQTSQLLPKHINLEGSLNWCPYIAPDESFILFSSNREGSSGEGDLYISFYSGNNKWSEAVNLGKDINTKYQERFPGLSPDGNYLFFTRSCDIPDRHELYWVDAKIIEQIKKTVIFK